MSDDGKEIPTNAAWRRMTADDAADAGALALAMNNATNNASLVLAFELSKGGKVLLFVGDAQAGNWRSWSDDEFDDDGNSKVTGGDLLGRTVLYKVGHHGSHNATMKGSGGQGPRQPRRDGAGQVCQRVRRDDHRGRSLGAPEAEARLEPSAAGDQERAGGKVRRARPADRLADPDQAGRGGRGRLAGVPGPGDRDASLFRSEDRSLTATARRAVA